MFFWLLYSYILKKGIKGLDYVLVVSNIWFDYNCFISDLLYGFLGKIKWGRFMCNQWMAYVVFLRNKIGL